MAKIHYFQRYAGTENVVTNNTLQLVARIYNYSSERASQLLTELTGEPIEIGIEISQQQRRGLTSVPDGTIVQRPFKVLIEAKVGASLNMDQLVRHSTAFEGDGQKVLLLLTRSRINGDEEAEIERRVHAQQSGIIFRNVTYEQVCAAVMELFEEHEHEMRTLVEDYVEYCNDENLIDRSKYLMRIVPCGHSLNLNKKYGIYFQPSDRGYTTHRYLGVYANKAVQALWELDSVFDIELDSGTATLTKENIQGRHTDDYDDSIRNIITEAKSECGYEIHTGHRFFCGTPFETDYKKASSGGIQNARFKDLRDDDIGEFAGPKELAEKLRLIEWG